MRILKSIVSFICLLLASISNGQTVVHLTCDMAVNPLAITKKQPKLGWQLLSENSNVSQKAYQILVASSEEKLQNHVGDVWDSGKVNSNKSQLILYNGASLKN